MHARKCPLKAPRNCLVQTQFTQSYQAQLHACACPSVPSLLSIHIQQIKAVIISAAHARCCMPTKPPTPTHSSLRHLLYCCCCCMLHCSAHRRVTSTLCLRLSRLDCTIDCTTLNACSCAQLLLVLLLRAYCKQPLQLQWQQRSAITAAVVAAAAAALRLVHVGDLSRLERCPAQALVVASDSEGYEQHSD
jgi:hypothetical protein